MPAPHTEARLADFMHRLGHEVLTPLSGVTMLLTAMRAPVAASGPELAFDLDEALAATRRVTRLVRAVVDYCDAGVRMQPPGPVDCGALVAEVAAELAAEAPGSGGGGALHVAVEGALPVVSGDRAALRRVFGALLDNAVRYAGERAPEVSIRAARRGPHWHFEVADRGIGIAPEDHERVFEPLCRLHAYDRIPGHGLGLATCARIVAAHGGAIGLRSRPGEGTEVWFTLPATAEPALAGTGQGPATSPRSPRAPR